MYLSIFRCIFCSFIHQLIHLCLSDISALLLARTQVHHQAHEGAAGRKTEVLRVPVTVSPPLMVPLAGPHGGTPGRSPPGSPKSPWLPRLQACLPHERLFQGETDGSSFPNGGLRVTHSAAAFTTWDRASPPFVMDKRLGEGFGGWVMKWLGAFYGDDGG